MGKKEILSTPIFLLLPTFLSAVAQRTSLDISCPEHCVCVGVKVTCDGVVPDVVPDTADEIELSRMELANFTARMFCNVTWHQVTKLSFVSVLGKDFTPMQDHVFACMSQLRVIKLDIPQLFVFTSNTFYGLPNILELDLSGCKRIMTPAIVTALSDSNVLHKLAKLDLDGTGWLRQGINISQSLVDVLAVRHITSINISSTALSYQDVNIEHLCDTLQSLNISNTQIQSKSYFDRYKTCNSLQTVDISGLYIKSPPLPKHLYCTNMSLKIGYGQLFSVFWKTRALFISHFVISVDHELHLSNCSVNITVENTLKEIHATGYNIPQFDCEIHISTNHLQYIDFSNNNIETIGPNVFKNLVYLKEIDLSNNKISQQNLLDDTFAVLFGRNSFLVNINLANNRIKNRKQHLHQIPN